MTNTIILIHKICFMFLKFICMWNTLLKEKKAFKYFQWIINNQTGKFEDFYVRIDFF